MLKKGDKMCKYWMYNVVIYDGVDAFVSKFILPDEMPLDSFCRTFGNMGYDGEVLKLDKLYPVKLDNIIALKDGNSNEQDTFNRFNEMFF